MKAVTILAASDFSEAARSTLERAAMITASIGNARLELLNVASARSLKTLKRLLSAEAGSVETLLIEEAAAILRRAGEDISARFSIPVGTFVAVGNPAEEIVSYANELDASLLVVGGRGLNAARDLWLGTTAEKVIRRTRRHVLVVKQPANSPYQRVLMATDFSEWSLLALKTARAIAPNAMFTVLHAFEAPFEGRLQHAGVSEETIAHYRYAAQLEAEKAAQAFVDNANISDACTITHGYASRVIRETSERMRPDLIAVGKHGQSFIEELLIGSVSEHVLADATCDVLVAANTGQL